MQRKSAASLHLNLEETTAATRAGSESSVTAPSRSGNLYAKGFFRWNRWHVELHHNTIHISLVKGGIVKKTFHLRANTLCEDNSARAFCFQLKTPATKDVILLAAENIAEKELWMESIQTSLSLLRLADRKLREKDKKKFHEEAVKQYITRPIIYFKVIRARNLTSKDNNGFSDPYVKVILGSSSVRTTTRKKNLNPDWGMVFSFDWEINMRYAVVEVWDEDYSSADDFLGVVYIPIFTFYDGYNSKAWYPLGKRSYKSNVSGEIEIEISCSGQPDGDLLAWQFFYEAQKLPEFTMNLVAAEDGSGQIGLRNVFVPESNIEATTVRGSLDSDRPALDFNPNEYATNGFPCFFPCIELEVLEDISLTCELVISSQGKKVAHDGVLLLTSYRLLFISLRRILAERNPDNVKPSDRESTHSAVSTFCDVKPFSIDSSDLTTQIYLSSISHVTLSSENDSTDVGISYDCLKIKTCDCRQFTFLFKDDGLSTIVPTAGNIINKAFEHLFKPTNEINFRRRQTNASIDQTVAFSASGKNALSPFHHEPVSTDSHKVSNDNNRRKMSILSSYNPSAETSIAYLSQYGNLSALEVAWLNIVRGPLAQAIEAADSPEGPACHRFNGRIKNRTVNRGIERYRLLMEHYELINDIRSCCNLGGFPPPSLYDFEVRLSDRFLDPQAIYVNGIARLTSDFTESERTSKLSFSSTGPLSESGFASGNDLSAKQLPLGWTNTTPDETTLSVGNQKRKKTSLNELIKRIHRSEGIRNHFTKLFFNLESSWRVYDAAVEYRRMGIPNERWRFSTCNTQYELCDTYPATLIVPANIDDDVLIRAAAFRSKGRIPTLCWLHPKNGASITRASQPLAGLANNRSAEDELLIAEIQKASQPSPSIPATAAPPKDNPFLIIDARPLLNARAQQAVGKGVENEKNYANTCVLFMDIPNIHAVRKSLELVEEAVFDEANFTRGLELSQWQGYLYRILLAVNRIVHCVHRENISLLVHCSDGWDRTSQLTSLSMLLLDDYYRTLDGFLVLIEKEWMSFGHKFADRLGWTQEGWKDEERSPIFFQFLDCVHQYLHQLPHAFEFNIQLLLFLAEHLSSGLFGNFFFNCEYDMMDCTPWYYSLSIWMAVLGNRSRFLNPNYQRSEQPLIPIITRSKLLFWEEWFLRWHDRVWLNSWIYCNDTEIRKKQEFTWTEDHTAPYCYTCDTKFTLFRRRHHCRCCGLIFCDPCSRETRVIPAISRFKALRCCNECATAIDLMQAEVNASRRTTRKTDSSVSRLGGGSHVK